MAAVYLIPKISATELNETYCDIFVSHQLARKQSVIVNSKS